MISTDSLDSTIIKTFRNSGYRATPQRIAISRYILRNHEHPSAQKTYQEVKKTHPTVSLATIYTTIKILKKTGLICELKLPQSQTRYDPNTEPHAHLVCLQCGSVRLDGPDNAEIGEKCLQEGELHCNRIEL